MECISLVEQDWLQILVDRESEDCEGYDFIKIDGISFEETINSLFLIYFCIRSKILPLYRPFIELEVNLIPDYDLQVFYVY